MATLESKPFCDGHHKTVSFKNSRETKGHIVNEAQFIAVANDADLREGGLLGVDVDGTEVVLARVDGLLYAIGGVCTHQHARLADGEICGRRVVCPLHGGEFELTTGCAARLPATESEPVYDVNVEGGKILVSNTPRS